MPKALFVIFLFSSLFDWYNVKYGVRVFDLLAFIVVIFYFLAMSEFKIRNLNYQILFLLPGVLMGVVYAKVHHVFFFLFSFYVLFNLYMNFSFDKRKLIKQIKIIIYIHVIVFMAQYIAFYTSGYVLLDYREAFGMRPLRIWNHTIDFFRAAGLYEEPNSYAVSLYMLSILYYILHRKIDYILVAACVTIFLSESLWGFGAVVIILGVVLIDKGVKLTYITLSFLSIIALLILDSELHFLFSPTTYRRFSIILTDGSFIARYGIDYQGTSMLSLFFGHGIGADGYFKSFGGNGYSAVIYYFGLVGALGFCLVFYRAAGNFIYFMAILFILSTTPMIFYFMFWIWLALIYRYNYLDKREAAKKKYFLSST